MSNSYPAHEGLQVAPSQNDAPEVYHDAPFTESGPGAQGQGEKFGDVHQATTTAPKRWCGLRKKHALIVLAVVIVIVVAAVVGGAVGGSQANRNNRNNSDSAPQSTTPSKTTASSEPASSASEPASSASEPASSGTPSPTSASSNTPVPTSGVLALNCPAINNTQYTATSGSTKNTFVLYCLKDFSSKSRDFGASLAYSFNSCIDKCVEHNAGGEDPPCQALTFGANLTQYHDANCFLKTAITGVTEYLGGQGNQAGALLLG